ncbi:hypothetical protein BDB01DRAFT_777165 [Pilobolus umbonatus]|nr:hypothetical protein BDB01DRAFT_777165 [Pilobolus umbonatus]
MTQSSMNDDHSSFTLQYHLDQIDTLSSYELSISDLSDDDNMSMLSADLECYMEFPPCPTTLPKLNSHKHPLYKTEWPVMHEEYDPYYIPMHIMNTEDNNNRNSRVHASLQDDMSIFSDISSMSSSSSQYDHSRTANSEYSNNPSDIYFREPLHRHPSITIEDLIMQPPPLKPFVTSPGQIFKHKFQKAVNKMKKTNLIASSIQSKEDKINYKVFNKKHASELPSNDSSTISSNPSLSVRLHNQVKGKLGKLFKK